MWIVLTLLFVAAQMTSPTPGARASFDVLTWLAEVKRCPIRVYNAKDDKGATLDTIKIVQLGKADYLGIYHAVDSGVFALHLARSSDLSTWKRVLTLDRHAHQGTLRQAGKRWVAAWEKDGPRGNFLHVRAYNSTKELIDGVDAQRKDIPRSLSRGAEGTPSIEAIERAEDWASSRITIRFHFYRNLWVDRQAEGVLTDFRGWTAAANEADNGALENVVPGNLGDRDSFVLKGTTFDLIEAQLKRNSWASWRVLLRDRSIGNAFRLVPFQTDAGSTAFANPTVTPIELPDGRQGIVGTLFIPKEGAGRGEAGELIYAKPLPPELK